MTGLLARDALLISLVILGFGAVMVPVAVRRQRRDLLGMAYAAVYTNFALVTLATGAMLYALVTHDFSVG